MLLLRKVLALATVVLGLAAVGCMSVPAGLHVYATDTGCTSDGRCLFHDGAPHNFYDVVGHEIVVVPGQPLKVVAHEACHAHQQQEVRDELGEDVSVTEVEWYRTQEAAEYAAFTGGIIHGWSGMSAPTLLEDFAEACGRYLAQDPRYPGDPAIDAFFTARDFR